METIARRDLLKRVFAVGLAAPSIAALVAACRSTPPPAQTSVATSQAGASTSGIQGRTLRLRLFEDIRVMDPSFISTGSDTIVSELVYSKLLQHNVNTGKTDPDLAESWTVTPDGKTYTFKLRQGVVWHGNYGELTSADVKYSWERIMDKSQASQYYPDLQPIDKVEAPDPYTVVVRMKDPYPAFIDTVVAYTPGYIVNQKAIESMGDKYVSSPIGTGPYQFVNWTPGASAEVKVFDKYFGRQQTVSNVRFFITTQDDVAEAAVEKGDVDVAYVHGADNQVRALQNKTLKNDVIAGPRILHLELNMDHPPLDNLKVRQALQYATDKASIVKYVLLDQAKVASTFLNPTMFAYDDTELYPYDPDNAKALLADAGFPNGLPKPLVIMVGIEKEYVDVVTAIQQQWTKVGVQTDIQSGERAVTEKRRRARDFDLNMQAIARFDPSQYLLPYESSAGLPYPNVTGYKGADDFILKAVVETDDTKRKELYGQAQRKIKEDSPLIPLYYPNFMIAIRSSVDGARADPTRVYNVRDIRFTS